MAMNLVLPESAEAYFGKLDQAQMEAARRLLQDSDQLLLIGKMLLGPGAGGISADTMELYETALAIQARRFREGPNGWYVVT